MNAKQKAAGYSNIWLPEPENHDFPAAQDYLELISLNPMQPQHLSKN